MMMMTTTSTTMLVFGAKNDGKGHFDTPKNGLLSETDRKKQLDDSKCVESER